MEQTSLVHMINPKNLIGRYLDVSKITVYLVNSNGYWENQYYSLVETEEVESSIKEILNHFEKQAKANGKKLKVTNNNDYYYKLEVEGETQYTIQIFVESAVVTKDEFHDAKTQHPVQKMLESMMA